jgi:hypothetical protein
MTTAEAIRIGHPGSPPAGSRPAIAQPGWPAPAADGCPATRLTRIREQFDATGDNARSVSYGVRTTAGIITGAALIMVAVFAGFSSAQLVMFQQMGSGLGVAVRLTGRASTTPPRWRSHLERKFDG